MTVARVGVIGFGYVGRATGHALRSVAEIAFFDPALPDSCPLEEVVRSSDAVFICVPTPSGADGATDLRAVHEVVAALAELATRRPAVLRSTVPPGTTEALAARYPSLHLSFCPEFLRERHHLEDAAAPARVALGWSRSADAVGRAVVRGLFRSRFPDVPILEIGATEAELLKHSANALFGVKVSFANEMAELASRLGVDWESVRQALVLDPRVGDAHLQVPGPDGRRGFGGSCLPKDMSGLLAFAADQQVDLPVVAAAMKSNRARRGP